jgi:TRAP-type C4-dicarboxylate transport system substrate-binding protein
MGVFSSVDPRLAAAEVPFLYNNIKAEAAAQPSLVPMYNEFLPEKFNQKMLGAFACLPLEIIGNKPVKTLADFKGLMVQAVSPVASSTITALGGNPVPSPFVEGYTVLEKKTVDASMTSTMFQVVFKLYEVAKYETLGYIIPASLGLFINMDVYNSLPKDIQQIMDEEGNGLTSSANAFFATMYDDNKKFLTEQGIEVYVLPADERAKWRDLVWPVSQKIIADMGDWGQRELKVADEVNAKYPY